MKSVEEGRTYHLPETDSVRQLVTLYRNEGTTEWRGFWRCVHTQTGQVRTGPGGDRTWPSADAAQSFLDADSQRGVQSLHASDLRTKLLLEFYEELMSGGTTLDPDGRAEELEFEYLEAHGYIGQHGNFPGKRLTPHGREHVVNNLIGDPK